MFNLRNIFKRKSKDSDLFMEDIQKDTRKLSNLIKENYDLTNEEYILYEINKFKISPKRLAMIKGENYYIGKQDILRVKRKIIDENGELKEVNNLPNNHVVDNQYKKMVDQKSNYLLGKPFSVQTDNEEYAKVLKKEIFNKNFKKKINNTGKSSLNQGIAWLYPYYGNDSKLKFKKIEGYELMPFWEDSEHTILKGAYRLYETINYNHLNKREEIIEKIEVYTLNGKYNYILDGNKLLKDKIPFEPYMTVTDKKKQMAYNWEKIPLIPFKYNDKEIPLLNNVKSLQDGINSILSIFENNMEEDVRNTLLVLVGYAGENLAEFRQNLTAYGAVKVDENGDLKTLQIEVNSENYKSILEIFKKALIENAMGYDAKDDKLGGNANQLNIKSMYSDIDLDANSMEAEFQASFEELLWFVNCYLANSGQGNFENEDIDIIFDRDMLMDEGSIIDNINKSADLSLETRISNHPWVDDPQKELERIKNEKKENMEQYDNAFINNNKDDESDEVDEE